MMSPAKASSAGCAIRGHEGERIRDAHLLAEAHVIHAHAARVLARTNQPGNLRASLYEAENVVDEQQHVAMFVVAEILGHRQGDVPNAEPAARWFVHLAKNHDGGGQHARILHLAIQLLAFPAPLADPAENAHPAMPSGHVVNDLRQQDRFSDARTAEESRLAAALQRSEQVDDFDARFEYLRFGGSLDQCWRWLMDCPPFDATHRAAAVNGPAKDIEHPRKDALSNGRLQRCTGVFNLVAPRQPLRRH